MDRCRWKHMAFALMLPVVFLVAGCDDGPSGVDGESSSVSLRLTDAPSAELDSAWVEIQQISLQAESEAGPGGTTLFSGSTGLISLTTLADSALSLVENQTVPSGTYGQLRVILGAAAVQTEGGQVFSRGGAAEALGKVATGQLQCPSCSQTGLKVLLPDGSLQLENESKILVLDFDVSQSFGRQAGMSGMWVMHPVIHTSDLSTSGTIEGQIVSNIEIPECPEGQPRDVQDFRPHAISSSSDTSAAQPDSSGVYRFSFLSPDTYQMSFAQEVDVGEGMLVFSASASNGSVDLESSQTKTVDYTINQATCQSSGS